MPMIKAVMRAKGLFASPEGVVKAKETMKMGAHTTTSARKMSTAEMPSVTLILMLCDKHIDNKKGSSGGSARQLLSRVTGT